MRTPGLLISACLLALAGAAQTSGKHSGPWEIEDSGAQSALRGIHAVSGAVAWASGTDGVVLRSEDAGYEWEQCAIPPGAGRLDFRAIWAWDAQTAMVMSSGPGDDSRLFRTTDGGSTWKPILSNPTVHGFWDGLLFLNRVRGILYGDPVSDPQPTPIQGDGRAIPLLFTSDGGNTWTPTEGIPSLPTEAVFAASNSAMAASQGWIWLGTSRARVLRSKDARRWQSAQTPLASGNDSSGVFSLAFRDARHGVAVGGDYRRPSFTSNSAAYSSDGGNHWNAAVHPPHGYRSAVAWDEQDRAWITVGANGSDISYDDGVTWQWLDGGNWNALSLPWAVGPHGQIGKLGPLPAKPATGTRVSR